MSALIQTNTSGLRAAAGPYLPAETILDLSYGNDARHKMDVYLPGGRNTGHTPSMILMHGGGWSGGSKSDFSFYIDSFRHRMPGYAIFNLNYRLAGTGHLFPAQENDIRQALDFIAGKASGFGISPSKLVLLGASAGAHLALLQAYKYRSPAIAAVIDFFGPADLTLMYQKPTHPLVTYALKLITGTTPALHPELYHESSPVNFIDPHSPPTIIFHGSEDPVVSSGQSELLAERLKAAGVRHQLVIYPRHHHGWHGSTLSDSFNCIEGFLKANVD